MTNSSENNADLKIKYIPINLKNDIICEISEIYTLDDKPITYLHHHNNYELGYCINGQGLFNINGQLKSFEDGDIIVIPPGLNHLAMSIKKTKSLWVWIYPSRDFTALYSNIKPDIFNKKDNGNLNFEIKKIIEERYDTNNKFKNIRISSRLHLILTEILNIQNNFKTYNFLDNIILSSRIENAIKIIYTECTDGLTVEILAKKCNITPSGLYRIFKKELQCSPKTYMDSVKVKMACSLLKTKNYSMTYICDTLGFGAISTFNRTFKIITGDTPLGWLRKISD